MKLPAYPRTKPSGVEWLGDVPEHWEVKRLSYLATLKSGENITSELIAEGGDYPVYGGNGLRGNYHKFTHRGHHALIGRQGALCGNINYASGEFYASEHALVVSPLKEFAVVWMGELLRAMNLGQYSVTAAQPGIAAEMIRGLRIPVPSLAEQRSIAAFLDRETGRVDRLVAKKRELIERLKEKRTALISLTVTRGLPPAAARAAGLPEDPPLKPSGVAWLDDVPVHWEVSKLKYIKASIPNAFVDGPFGSNLKTEHFVSDGDVFVIESGFATRGEMNEENLKTIEMEHFQTICRSATSSGDIIIAKIGANFGLNHILPPLTKPAVVSGNSLKLTIHPKSCTAAYFHYQLLHLKWCGAIDLLANITAQPALSLGGMNTLSCVRPPLPEQAAIAAYLDAETAKLDALVGKVDEAVERLQEYRTALITAAAGLFTWP